MTLRTGITTGTCAAAAAKAAAIVLTSGLPPTEVAVRLPDGQVLRVPITVAQLSDDGRSAKASVRKDAGDDADVTDGLEIRAMVSFALHPLAGSREPLCPIILTAGEGIGTVTKPGLQVPPGQPAINPVPRQMILAAVGEVVDNRAGSILVEISIPGGHEVARQTFNPRLGIEGGLSILGTTGIVRPYCTRALHDALRCTLDVAVACGVAAPVLVPGNIGARAARRMFTLRDEQVIEAGNEWGFLLDEIRDRLERPDVVCGRVGKPVLRDGQFAALLIVGHPGKLAKLAQGEWDTHSARSSQAVGYVARLLEERSSRAAPDSPTVEGLLASVPAEERAVLAAELARRVRDAVDQRIGCRVPTAIVLVDMSGNRLGTDGDLLPWQ